MVAMISTTLIVMLGTWFGTISYQLFTVACLVHILAIVALNSKDACGYEPEPFDSYNWQKYANSYQ